MKSHHRYATPSHSSIHSSSRDHFVQPPSLIDRSLNYLNRKVPSSDDEEFDDYGLPRPSLSRRKSHPTRQLPRWQQLFTLPALLTLTWFLVLYWGERHVFHSSIQACDWSRWEKWPSDATPHHVILVADPQLVDPHTYPGRPWPLSTFTVRHTDLYLRRSFSGITKLLHPDTVFFLGDLFDGGREWSTESSQSPETRWQRYGKGYWMKEYERWLRIFLRHWNDGGAARAAGRGQQRGRKLIAGLPGNHDLGLAKGIQIPVRKRFNAFFGEGNRVDVVGNHTFVSVDTVSLSAMDQGGEEELWRPTKEFLDEIQTIKKRAVINELITQNPKAYQRIKYPHRRLTPKDLEDVQTQRRTQQDQSSLPSLPTILLSHIPLYRSPDMSCGFDREHQNPDSILIHKGYQYQNVLTPKISELLVDKLTNSSSSGSSSSSTTKDPTIPALRVFSGDDHDYCSVIHTSYGRHHIPEITVKSLSWAMGIRRPGFVMVTLWNPLPPTQPPTPNQDTPDGGSVPAKAHQQETVQTHLCLLPDQLGIFLRVYTVLFLVSVLTVLVRSWWRIKKYIRPGSGAADRDYPRRKQQRYDQGGGMAIGLKRALKDTGSTVLYMALAVGGWYVYLWR